MVKVGDAHPTSSRRLNRTVMRSRRGDLFVAMESKYRNSSVGAACCMPVLYLRLAKKQVAPTELNPIIRRECYKQDAPMGLKRRVSH